MSQPSARELIETLQLAPHPEGGHFREVYRSALSLGIPPAHAGVRSALTAIYFLLQEGEFSAWHRVRSEEAWIHLAGDPLELVVWRQEPRVLSVDAVGRGGPALQVVPAGVLQAARSLGRWSLVTCLVAPGFEFDDFEMPDREELLRAHPEHGEWIVRYTR